MGDLRGSAAFHRSGRRWVFADCIFDEGSWSLTVQGRRVPVETKPLVLLRELLANAGHVVAKDALLDSIWPDVTVVEASLTTAVHKLRHVLGDDRRKHKIIETVSGIGYRISIPVEVQDLSGKSAAPFVPDVHAVAAGPATASSAAPAATGQPMGTGFARLMTIAAALAIGIAALTVGLSSSQNASATSTVHKFSQREAATAIRELDVDAINRMIDAGWDPNSRFDKAGTDAFMFLLNICEWDRGHDRRKMLMIARSFLEAGADMTRRNIYGDTYYSIAKARRYCGPDHPVTQMLEAMCYGGDLGPKDRCLATYELTAQQRRAQGLPPKA
jgi:DNA-binding winged helix-turn-helix (wHTH) protein